MADQELVILGGARTPFGTFGKSLKDIPTNDLGAIAAKAAMERTGVKPEDIDHVVVGNVIQSQTDAIYCARHIALKAGVPIEVPALTVNRLCGSGMQSIVEACWQIRAGEATTVLAGGAENMSQVPYALRGVRWGQRLGNGEVEDVLMAGLTDGLCGVPMSGTAENLATQYSISREDQDQFAYESQMKAKDFIESGRHKDEIVPVEVPGKKGTTLFEIDEHPRFDTTVEALSKLKPAFGSGTVTAGNASGINDAGSAVIVTTAAKAEEMGWTPMARIVSWGIAGVEPRIMGIGPAPAMRQALQKAGLSFDDMDLVEVNEAFAAQCIAVQKECEIDPAKLNVNGGAIAIGHPLGASGNKLTLNMMYELARRNARYGIASLCIGGGQGIALVIENLKRG
ncbi:MAG TPA: acetyl-CoA C-acetyltransferase [bacterium]|nr:acetyl-CoA C-acetyltransferase [bacterium]